MDSVELNSTSVDWNDSGLTPNYVRTCLEDLAADQCDTEAAVLALKQRTLFLTGGVVLALGLAALTVKVQRALMNGLNGLGQALLTTQQYIGLAPPGQGSVVPDTATSGPGEGTVSEDIPPVSASSERAPKRSDEQAQSPLTVHSNGTVEAGSATYDPGPQPGPAIDPIPVGPDEWHGGDDEVH